MSILDQPIGVSSKKSKSHLETYTIEASLPPPVYQTFTEEDKSVPSFRSQVWVDGKYFKSRNSFPNKKNAECDAARCALTALRAQVKKKEHLVIHEDSAFCNAIVKIFAMKMNSEPPTYATNQTEAMPPMFVTSLQLNGFTYVGQASKDKKDAEQSAARAAILSILGSGSIMSEIVKSKSQHYEAFLKVKESRIVQGVGNNAPDAVNPSMEDIKDSVVAVKSPPPAEIPKPSSLVPFPAIVQRVLPEPNTEAPATRKKNRKKRKLNNGLVPSMEGKENEFASVKVPLPAEIPQPSSLVPFPSIVHVLPEPNTEAPRESVHISKEQKLLQASSSPSLHAIAPPPASSVTMVTGIDIVSPTSEQAPSTKKKKLKKRKLNNGLLLKPSMEGKENEVAAVKVPPPAEIPQPSSLVPVPSIVQHVLPEPNTVVALKSPAEIQQPSSLVTFPDIVQRVLPQPNTEAPRESVHVFIEQELLQASSSPSPHAIAPPPPSSVTMVPGIDIVPPALDQALAAGKRKIKKMRRKNRLLVNTAMEGKENEIIPVKVPPQPEIPQPSSLVPFPAIIQHVLPEPNTAVAVKSPPAEIQQPSSLVTFPDIVQHVLPEPNTEPPRESVHVFNEQELLLVNQAPATGKRNRRKMRQKNGLLANPSMEDKKNEVVAVKVPPHAEIPEPSSLVPFPDIIQHVQPELNTFVALKGPPAEIPQPISLLPFPHNVQHVLPEPNTEAPIESVHVVKEHKLLQASSSPSPHAIAPPASSVTMVPGIDIVPPALDQAPATGKKNGRKRKRKNGLLVNPSIEGKENKVVDVKDPPGGIPQPSSLVPFPAIVQHVLPEPNIVVAVKSPPTEIPHASSLVQFPDNVQHVLPEPNTEDLLESVHVFKEQKLLQVSSSLSPQAVAPPVASCIEIEKSLLQNPTPITMIPQSSAPAASSVAQ